jgi:hypothetical protein
MFKTNSLSFIFSRPGKRHSGQKKVDGNVAKHVLAGGPMQAERGSQQSIRKKDEDKVVNDGADGAKRTLMLRSS